jgi:hypothetical protein
VLNRPPSASPQSVTVAEDNGLIVTLGAEDPDGDVLTFTHTATAHGTLSGGGESLFYQPAANYFGPDSFTFTVDDGKGGTATATVTINVRPVTDIPVAQAGAASMSIPSEVEDHLVVVARNNQNVSVILNASGSTDVESSTLSCGWYSGAALLSTEGNPTVSLPVGVHVITLVVSDGEATASDTVTVEVFTPCDLVQRLASDVKAAALRPSERNGLLGHLNAACSTFANGNLAAGVHQLELFQARLNKKVAPHDPVLANTLNDEAQQIIDEVSGR